MMQFMIDGGIIDIKNLCLAGLAGFCVSCLFIPIFVALSHRLDAMSEVGGRNVGTHSVGRLGGLGVIFGILAAIAIQFYLDPLLKCEILSNSQSLEGVIVGFFIVSLLGFIDDIRRISAKWKLFVQIIVGILIYHSGFKISGIDFPLFNPFELGWLSCPATVFWVLLIINAVNLTDGLDGLAGGVVLFAATVNLVFGLSISSTVSTVLMVSVIGSVVGFLLFNWHPARVYLGDGGAYALGYILAVNTLLSPFQKAATGVMFLVPILATGFPIIDTILTVVRRLLQRRGLFVADRGHLHHIMLDLGISHRKVVICVYMFSWFLSSIAIAVVLNRRPIIGFVLIGVSMIGCVFWGVVVRNSIRQALDRIQTEQKEI